MKSPKPIPTTPAFWALRKCPLALEEIKVCQRTRGELRVSATAPRPDICARVARLAARVNLLEGGDIYRINDLVETQGVATGGSFEVRLDTPAHSTCTRGC